MKSNTSFKDRLAFDRVAPDYEQWRSTYPKEIVSDIVTFAQLSPNDRILEIGAGSGQLTLQFASKGFAVDAIEPSPNLSKILEEKLTPFPKCLVLTSPFEETDLEQHGYECVVSANAFHWVPKEVGYKKLALVSKPRGAIALLWSFPTFDSLSVNDINQVYNGVDETYRLFLPSDDGRLQMAAGLEEMKASNLFMDFEDRHYEWRQSFTSEGFTKYLSTFANYARLEEAHRRTVLSNIASSIEEGFGGKIDLNQVGRLRFARNRS
jgi:SAM-dependent methyltransferase